MCESQLTQEPTYSQNTQRRGKWSTISWKLPKWTYWAFIPCLSAWLLHAESFSWSLYRGPSRQPCQWPTQYSWVLSHGEWIGCSQGWSALSLSATQLSQLDWRYLRIDKAGHWARHTQYDLKGGTTAMNSNSVASEPTASTWGLSLHLGSSSQHSTRYGEP